MRRSRLGTWALVTTITFGVALALTTFGGASASPGGPPPFALSATNGTKTLAWQGGRSLALDVPASNGAWSGDGSRLAFVGPDNAIDTVRFDDGSDIGSYAPADSTIKSHPSWMWNGASDLLWSAHVVDPQTGASDVIQFARRDGGPVNTVALPTGRAVSCARIRCRRRRTTRCLVVLDPTARDTTKPTVAARPGLACGR